MGRIRMFLLSFIIVTLVSSSVSFQSYARPTSISHHMNRFVDGVLILIADSTGSPSDQARARLVKTEHIIQEIEDLSPPSEDDAEGNIRYAGAVDDALGEADELIEEACERDCSQETLRLREQVRVRAENATRQALQAVERNIERYRERHPGSEVPQGLLQAREQLRNAYKEQEQKRLQEHNQVEQSQKQKNGQGKNKGSG